LAGPVKAVSGFVAKLGHPGIEVEDTGVAVLEFRNGGFGTIVGTTAAYKGYPRRVGLYGTEGSAALEDSNITLWNFATEKPQDAGIRARFARTKAAGAGASDPAAISHVEHQRQLENLLQALASGGKVLCDGREGRAAVEIILAVYRSSRRRQRVALPLRRDRGRS
jgi:predicted dehydrogenase